MMYLVGLLPLGLLAVITVFWIVFGGLEYPENMVETEYFGQRRGGKAIRTQSGKLFVPLRDGAVRITRTEPMTATPGGLSGRINVDDPDGPKWHMLGDGYEKEDK
jgi:hypothetical protein